MEKKAEITASIVLYHSDQIMVKKAIDSYKPSSQRYLYIVDNSEERTDTYRSLPFTEYIFNGKNEGYGAAHNIAMKKAIEMGSQYHIVLNPDVSFEPSVIDTLKEYADTHDDVIYLLPKVIYPDGTLQYLCKLLPTPADLIFRRFLPSSWVKKTNDRYCLKMSGYDKIMNPPCLSGCFMFIRMDAVKEHDLFFDERYFMYCEDFDLMRRMHRFGKTVYYPYVHIVHDHAKASYKSKKMLLIHMHSAIQYFNKFGWIFDKERQEMNQKILNEIEEAGK